MPELLADRPTAVAEPTIVAQPVAATQPAASAQPVHGENYFHLNLIVADVAKAVAFYEILFDRKPFKQFPDYAEFLSDDPAIALGLTKYTKIPGGPINHIGLRFSSLDRLEALHQRLAAAGFAPTIQGTVNCCYAKGNKIWAIDPDHHLLELYVLLEDLPQFGYEEPPALAEESTGEVWEHRSPHPLPQSIPADDESLDEVGLLGTFNAEYPQDEIRAILREARRALKPGGKLRVQGLVGDRPFPGTPDFPGLASKVKSVPVEHEPVDMLAAAGFADTYFELHGDIKCLQAEGVQLRKIRMVAIKPRAAAEPGTTDRGATSYSVRYLGPFEEVELDAGLTVRRGETTPVSESVWQDLKTGPASKQFSYFADDAAPRCCGPRPESTVQLAGVSG